MAEPAKTFNDGGIKFNRQTVNLKDGDGTATDYILKKGNLKASVVRIKSPNENGVNNKQAGMLDIPEGKFTLQYIVPTDKPPASMQYFTAKDSGGTVRNLVLWDVDDQFGAGEEAILDCEVSEKQAQ